MMMGTRNIFIMVINLTFKINCGGLLVIRWCQNNSNHRVDGPAVVWLYDDGDSHKGCYYMIRGSHVKYVKFKSNSI
jgi:hypothetical protein